MDIFLDVIQAVIPILLIIGSGIYLSYRQILSPINQSLLNNMIISIFMPCLMITTLSRTVTVENIQKLWILPVAALLFVIINLILSWILVTIRFWLSGENDAYKYWIKSATIFTQTFRNSIGIPLPLIVGLLPDDELYSTSLILLYSSFANILTWSGGSLLVSFIPKKDHETDTVEIANNDTPLVSLANNFKFKTIFNALLTSTNISAILGLTIGLTPIRNLFYPSDAILYSTITKTTELLSSMTIPCVLISFAGTLYHGLVLLKQDFTLSPLRFDIIYGCIVNLILLPIIPISIILSLYKFDIIQDKLLLLVLLLESCMPPALNLPVICDSNENLKLIVTILMIYQYLFSLISLTLCSAGVLFLLF